MTARFMSESTLEHRKTKKPEMSEENASTAPLMNDTVDPKGKKFPYVCSKAICRG